MGEAEPGPEVPAARRLELRDLRADCSNCFGLCCVVPAFAASADFAVDKPAGQACTNLQSDSRCGIHTRLRSSGFAGCTVYDCFGAGQNVSQHTFAGQDWRSSPVIAREMFQVFPVLRDLHELLSYLVAARALVEGLPPGSAAGLRRKLEQAQDQVAELTRSRPETVLDLDPGEYRRQFNPLLLKASERVRAAAWPKHRPRDHRGADLIGAKLKGADLRAANLRGARLIGADLRSADLRSADLIGVDLRGADLRDADLTGALFLVQSQLESAGGNAGTRVSPPLRPPRHWS